MSIQDLFKSRWPSFRVDEILSPDGIDLLSRGVFVMRYPFLDKLQFFRDTLKLPFIINHGDARLRGFRSIQEEHDLNLQLGRKEWTYSMHVAGIAADISVEGLSVEALYKQALAFGWNGVGIYDSWVHIDDRDGSQARWDYRTIKTPIDIR